MNGRFAAALVAFALAGALVSRGPMLAEFLVQLRDPNIAGGSLFAWLLHWFGYAVVLALCAVLAGCAVLLAAWRTRVRGATDWNASLAAAMVALCMSARAGVSLDPIGWLCAAAVCLLVERDDDASSVALVLLMLAWAVLQGGAPLGSLLIFCAALGRAVDTLDFGAAFRRRAMFAGAAIVVGFLQLHAWPWHGYGPHVLYVDALRAGAQRDRLWTGDISAAAIGFSSIVIVAAWYGLKRRGRNGDALVFFVMLVLTLIDARVLPYFGIVCAPIAVDALASYYVLARSGPHGSALRYLPATLAASIAFIAGIAASEPKVQMWPQAYNEPGTLLRALAAQPGAHRLLCTHPRWCDGVQSIFSNIGTIADDRTGIEPLANRRAEAIVQSAASNWHDVMRSARIDAIIASEDEPIVALLSTGGWRIAASDQSRVLLERKAAQ